MADQDIPPETLDLTVEVVSEQGHYEWPGKHMTIAGVRYKVLSSDDDSGAIKLLEDACHIG